jgi:hypothetical protein
MVAEFADGIRQGRQPSSSGEEGMRDLEVVLKAYESARTGAPVTLEYGRARKLCPLGMCVKYSRSQSPS